jgi:hypothetical protein
MNNRLNAWHMNNIPCFDGRNEALEIISYGRKRQWPNLLCGTQKIHEKFAVRIASVSNVLVSTRAQAYRVTATWSVTPGVQRHSVPVY